MLRNGIFWVNGIVRRKYMKEYKLTPFYSPASINYKENLNEQQLKAVEYGDGPCLVLAGAGSGKTRVLIYRLAYLLEKGIPPQNILLATFTNKAAQEMLSRAESLLKSTLSGLWAGTFHHIGNMTLRREAALLGYADNFTIIDKEDSKDLIADCSEESGFTDQDKLFPKKDVIANIASLSLNSLKRPADIIRHSYPHLEQFILSIETVCNLYQEKKRKDNIMDFDDLLANWLRILQNEEVCRKYDDQFQYILVDEYQDTNRLQFEILKKLTSVHKNILAVGDDAQSIYSFRGAEIKNILNFPKTFEKAKIFKLEINYRSTSPILHLANKIIQQNVNQFKKTLSSIKGPGQTPALVQTKDIYQQAHFITQKVLELSREGIPLKEMAVLVRSHFQSLEIEVELLKRNIPYIVRGGVKFFEQAHIKDIMAYLKIAVNPRDEISFKRAAGLHKNIGRSYAYKIWGKINEQQNARQIEEELPKRQREGFKEFIHVYETLKDKNAETAIRSILPFYKDYCFLNFDNPDERMLDIEELAKMAASYPTIKRFIAEMNSYEEFKSETLVAPAQKDEALVLSTIHQSKGLEWDSVFIVGLSEHEFPHPKSVGSNKGIEEERRLFYVAVTRAKSRVYMVYPQSKYTFKNGLILSKPSMFIEELDESGYESWHLEK